MPIFRGQRVNRNNGSGAGRGDDPHAYGTPEAHGDEGKTRTQTHPTYPASGRMAGTYIGPSERSGEHRFLSAGSGRDDIYHVPNSGAGVQGLQKGSMYTFDSQKLESTEVYPYHPNSDFGHPGAPMNDTPVKQHDRNFLPRNKD